MPSKRICSAHSRQRQQQRQQKCVGFQKSKCLKIMGRCGAAAVPGGAGEEAGGGGPSFKQARLSLQEAARGACTQAPPGPPLKLSSPPLCHCAESTKGQRIWELVWDVSCMPKTGLSPLLLCSNTPAIAAEKLQAFCACIVDVMPLGMDTCTQEICPWRIWVKLMTTCSEIPRIT